jgi:hypothetical protein
MLEVDSLSRKMYMLPSLPAEEHTLLAAPRFDGSLRQFRADVGRSSQSCVRTGSRSSGVSRSGDQAVVMMTTQPAPGGLVDSCLGHADIAMRRFMLEPQPMNDM